MKKVYVVSHGDFVNREGINVLASTGLRKIEDLAIKIGPEIRGKNIKIISSKARCASDSAKVFSEIFQVGFEEHECLQEDDDCFGDFAQAIRTICQNDKKLDVLIVITHIDMGMDITQVLAVRKGIFPPYQICQTGQAYEIDFLKESCVLVA